MVRVRIRVPSNFTMMWVLESRSSIMRVRRAGVGGMVAVAVGSLALGFSPAARAQVKLEYKFPEGKSLSYKTTIKMHQVLTINGMEIPTDVEETVVASQTVGKRRSDSSV